MKKWIAIILVLVLFVGGGTYWYMGKKAKAKQASNVYIPTAVVQRGTLESDVSGSGSLSSDIDEDVTASISDTVYSVKVSVGQKVKKGQALLEYNNGTYLDAPDSGTITSLSVYAQTQVKPGQVVAHITNYTNLDTVVSVDELDIPKVKVGQPVEVTVNAYPSTKFTGKVTKIADTGTDTNGVSSFDVTVHLDNSKSLKPGMTTSANIITNKKANTLYVPIGAIHKQGNTTYVLVDSGSQNSGLSSSNSRQAGMTSRRQWRNMGAATGNAQMLTVKTGINNDNDIEILSGLKEGQVVQLPPIVRNSSTASSTGNGFGMYGGGGFGGGFGGNGFNRMNRLNKSNSNKSAKNQKSNSGGGGN